MSPSTPQDQLYRQAVAAHGAEGAGKDRIETKSVGAVIEFERDVAGLIRS